MSNEMIILIDDDPLIRAIWQFSAERYTKNIIVFSSADQFYQECCRISFDSIIYIDSNLGKGVRGEMIAKKIYQMGFANIYLTTGFYLGNIKEFPWIKGVVDKNPPWKADADWKRSLCAEKSS